MKIIGTPQQLIGTLENGEFAGKYGNILQETLTKLLERAGPRGKASGHVTLKLKIKVENEMAQITPELTYDHPKEGYGASLLWVTEDGELSTEHPRQNDMFSGPREVRKDRDAG